LSKELKQQRYFYSRVSVLKSNWVSSMLSNLSNTRFREYVRMNRESLNHILRLICENQVFRNKFTCLQISIENQLKYVFYRMRHDDSASDFLSIAIMWDVSEEHIFDCIKRVIETLCRLRDQFVKWSDARQKTRESLLNQKRQHDFIEVMKKIDETNIVLNTKSEDR
jgi:predicted DNA-binding protein YlxM (UPF0122 family)